MLPDEATVKKCKDNVVRKLLPMPVRADMRVSAGGHCDQNSADSRPAERLQLHESMWSQRQPVEVKRRDRFRPPHCPWPDCSHHDPDCRARFPRVGFSVRARGPRTRVQRFLCKKCGRTFCQDSLAITYRLKRPELLIPIASLLVSGAAHRQVARHLGCAPSTVTRMSERIGRHAERIQELLLNEVSPIQEPAVLDHFDTFVRSQQERLGIATAVGQQSWFVYALNGAAYLRLKGRSVRKRAVRSVRPVEPHDVVRSTRDVVARLCRASNGELHLISDDHPAYRTVVRSTLNRRGPQITHQVFGNPDRSSKGDPSRARARDRAMFAVDLLHKILRHSQAHHRRETIAFGRKRASVVARAAILAVWRNLIKRVSERRPATETPAMRLGLTERPWTWGDLFQRRIFDVELSS